MVKFIEKRNKLIENFNRDKLSKSLEKVFLDLNLDKNILIDYIEDLDLNIVKSSDLNKLLIKKAVSLTNIDNFENLKWRFVASRIVLETYIKSACINRNNPKSSRYVYDYYEFLQKAIKNNVYDKKILEEYSKEEIEEFRKELKEQYDLGFDYAGMNILTNRYLIKLDGKEFEKPQEMFLSISLLLALPEKKENRIKIAKEFYHAIGSRKISLATPILLNLRKPGGNLASCFIGAMDDDLDSIYYTLDQLAQISKNAGGCGVNVSRIRCAGSYIKNVKGASSGVMPWIKLINDTGIAVNQQGARAGAITVALDVWHYDIEEFLHCQTENGDHRKKAFDIFPQIVIPDLFMKRVEENKNWTLFDPYEIRKKCNLELAELYGKDFEEKYIFLESQELEFKKIVNAKELFKMFLKTVVETGMPYVFFKDTTNNINPNKHCGIIGNANLCTESFSNFKPSKIISKEIDKNKTIINKTIQAGELHCCNLVSLNLSCIKEHELEKITSLSVRILDNTIDISTPPVLEADKHNTEYRILGVGSMGLADYLAKNKLLYKNGLEEIERLYENIAYFGIKESINLAKERGVYPKYYNSDWSKGIIIGKDEEWFRSNNTYIPREYWLDLINDLKNFGIRNGGLFAIAPNTSTSLLMGCSASVLPVYSKFFIDKASNGNVPICPPFLSKETFWYYQENKNMNQNDVINAVSVIQKWTDQGISMELCLNLNNGIRAKDIYDLYINAWKKECKTVYYIRSIALRAELPEKKEECISCAN